MIISIIAAVSKNNVIGYKNRLPWKLPADLIHFKKITMGHHLIMGLKTFESIGKPLPGRINIILTFDSDYKTPECITASSLEEALKIASFNKEDEVFIIGGASVFRQTIDIADKLYITYIDKNFKGDVYFPEIDGKKWKTKSTESHVKDEKNPYNFSFIVYEK